MRRKIIDWDDPEFRDLVEEKMRKSYEHVDKLIRMPLEAPKLTTGEFKS